MRTEIYSSGPPSRAGVNVGEVLNVLISRSFSTNKTFSAGVRCIVSYGNTNMQSGLQMLFTITVTRAGVEQYVFVVLQPHQTRELYLGLFDFQDGDMLRVSASSVDASEGEVAATFLVDVE